MNDLLTFRSFNDPALAQNLANIFGENNIKYVLEEGPVMFNTTFVGRSETSKEYLVKISSNNFVEANRILTEYELKFTDDVEPDYYLLSFSQTELMDVIEKADEWSAFDVVLAKKLLNEKGITIDESAEQRMNEKRIIDLKTPEPSETLWIVIGYFFALIGGVLGFFIGWQLWKSKKTLPNGEQVFSYTDNDRNNGERIFYLSIAGLAGAITIKIINL